MVRTGDIKDGTFSLVWRTYADNPTIWYQIFDRDMNGQEVEVVHVGIRRTVKSFEDTIRSLQDRAREQSIERQHILNLPPYYEHLFSEVDARARHLYAQINLVRELQDRVASRLDRVGLEPN